MTQNEFLVRLQDEIQAENPLNSNVLLEDIPEWDSLAMLGVLTVFYENDISIEMSEFEDCKSVKDILIKAGYGA